MGKNRMDKGGGNNPQLPKTHQKKGGEKSDLNEDKMGKEN